MESIKISIDEKACVGCSLCVEICPTKVFENRVDKKEPVVAKEKECFGCLSCTEICPATAINHTNLPLSMSLYN
ncbi:MAG: 4Fe-4S binding protein, partial [Chitinispirillaceae bacterium]|nr:4Fe-4S binding protein [Chitinispirillaceae bacterium]